MIITIKRKTIIALLLTAAFAAALAAVIVAAAKPSYSAARKGVTVVVDAGHGGADAGVTGYGTGVKESDLNLAVAKKLRDFLEGYGIDVVMTRSGTGGLYGLTSKNRKRADMEKRKAIIEEANPALVISVHMNAFPQRSQRGAQVFYDKKGSAAGQKAASALHSVISKSLPESDRPYLSGDYYILNCTDRPAALVECGFLSNPEDEKLLMTAEHQEKVAYAVFCGAVLFLGVL